MYIYEFGASVRQCMLEKSSGYKTYACVVDEPEDKSFVEAFVELQTYLQDELKLQIIEIDHEKLTVTVVNKDVYTLAHEDVYSLQSPRKEPCSILRHALNTLFTMDSLYKDEFGTIVDITGRGVRDIHNKTLKFVNDQIVKIINTSPEIIVDVLTLKYDQNYGTDNTLWRSFETINPVRPLNDFIPLKNLIEKHGDPILNKIKNSIGLSAYLINQCGLKYAVTFEPDKFNYKKDSKQNLALKFEEQPPLDDLEDEY